MKKTIEFNVDTNDVGGKSKSFPTDQSFLDWLETLPAGMVVSPPEFTTENVCINGAAAIYAGDSFIPEYGDMRFVSVEMEFSREYGKYSEEWVHDDALKASLAAGLRLSWPEHPWGGLSHGAIDYGLDQDFDPGKVSAEELSAKYIKFKRLCDNCDAAFLTSGFTNRHDWWRSLSKEEQQVLS